MTTEELDGRYSPTSTMSHRELLSYYGYTHPGWLAGGLSLAISAGLRALRSGCPLGDEDLAVLHDRGDRISRHHPEFEAAVGVLVTELERASSKTKILFEQSPMTCGECCKRPSAFADGLSALALVI